MSEYLIQSETLTSIGDQVREITGTTDTLSPSGMTTNLESANSVVESQQALITEIQNILETKGAIQITPVQVDVVASSSSSSSCAGYIYYDAVVNGKIESKTYTFLGTGDDGITFASLTDVSPSSYFILDLSASGSSSVLTYSATNATKVVAESKSLNGKVVVMQLGTDSASESSTITVTIS